ncbi:MAG: helicase [Anaerolineae bacterium]|nr:helicase [Anaerolineae bacterium]
MTSSDLTFFTNEPGRILRERFSLLLGNTRAFDCLVGYFFVSGFYKLYPDLENVEKIRILVGLQTDRMVYKFIQKAQEQPVLPLPSHAVTQEQAATEVRSELEAAADTAEVESGVLKFIAWLQSGKLEIKAYPAGNLHAKVYIMTFKAGQADAGRVITGSSNLTQAGLQDNFEFNVELKSAADYDFALNKFNELWANAVDIAQPYAEVIQQQSPYAQFTPYELYLKFLYEYFRAELNSPVDLDDLYIPEGFKKLRYQAEAVSAARRVLAEYGGCFLSDVVGLGKTYMAALLAQQLEGRTLVIAPPHLLDRDKKGSWPNVFSDFQVRQTDFESSGKLEHLLACDLSRYANVFIDESHRFRTETTLSYANLAQICRGKRVILVSATPLNNSPGDILSQVKLFQNGKASTLPNLRNLEAFFANLEKNLSGLDRLRDREQYFQAVQANARATRENVLKYLMIRRTRTEIAAYYADDLQQQGLKFPEVQDPEPLFYQFNQKENATFEETLRLLTQELTYARYKPLTYYIGQRPTQEQQGRNLARFMKILMIKRLESSFHAFRLSLGRFTRSYQRMITEFQKGYVYLSKEYSAKLFEALEADDQETLERLLQEEKAEQLDAADFRPEFFLDLQHDAEVLREIQRLWEQVKRDPKWETFRAVLTTQPRMQASKLIIFSESQETAAYLVDLIAAQVEPRVLGFSAKSGDAAHRDVIANFDANAFQPRDDYRILVSTEVLSEGVNLHRANVVINYDIPWNPIRLIQRVGRVNRVDTTFDAIYTYNFFPTAESNDALKLKEAAEAKIHAFIEMLGADARLLTEGEEVKSYDLFARLNSKKTLTGEDDAEESELAYLSEIRTVRDTQPDLFTRIKRLPKKARSTRKLDTETSPGPALLTYFRQGHLDKFYMAAQETSQPDELDFLAAAKLLHPADPAEPRQAISADFYTLLERNKAAFAAATSTADDDVNAGGSRDAYLINRLKAKEIRLYHGFTEDDEAYIQEVRRLLEDGVLPKAILRKLSAAFKKESAPLKILGILHRDIPAQFSQPVQPTQPAQSQNPREVILSSYLSRKP